MLRDLRNGILVWFMGQDRPSWPHPLGIVMIIELLHHKSWKRVPKIIPPRVQTLCGRLDCLACFSPLRLSCSFSGWILICHLPPLAMASFLPFHPIGWRISRKNYHNKEPAHSLQLLRKIPFSPDWGRDRKQCSHPPSEIHLQAQHSGAASPLCSEQILHTGKCLSEDSSCPLHSWLKIHFKTRFIYILITSAITITLPLLRNCSTACRSPTSEPEISENEGLKVCRVERWKIPRTTLICSTLLNSPSK